MRERSFSYRISHNKFPKLLVANRSGDLQVAENIELKYGDLEIAAPILKKVFRKLFIRVLYVYENLWLTDGVLFGIGKGMLGRGI